MNELLNTDVQKVLIVGPTGSGKSTLGRSLSQRHGLPHIELDTLQWMPNWTSNPDFQQLAENALNEPQWIIEGGYVVPIQNAWPIADQVIWIDLPFLVVLRQLVARSMKRIGSKEPVCNGNVETMETAFLTYDSVLIWLLRTYRKRRRLFRSLMEQHPDIPVTRIRTWENRD